MRLTSGEAVLAAPAIGAAAAGLIQWLYHRRRVTPQLEHIAEQVDTPGDGTLGETAADTNREITAVARALGEHTADGHGGPIIDLTESGRKPGRGEPGDTERREPPPWRTR